MHQYNNGQYPGHRDNGGGLRWQECKILSSKNRIPFKTFKTFHSKEVFERWMIALYCLRQISFKTFTLGLSWKLLRNFYSWKMNDCTVLFEAQGWGRARRVWDVPKWTLPWTCWLPQVFYKKTKDFHLNPDIFCTFYSWGLIRESGPKFD